MQTTIDTWFFPRIILRGLVLTALGLAATAVGRANAASMQDAKQIERLVANFAALSSRELPGRVDINVREIDPRLALAQCVSMETFVPAGTRLWGNANIGVRCRAPVNWTLFVPVTVRVYTEVLLAARPLERGRLLKREDFLVQERDLTLLPAGTLSDISMVAGKVLHNPLAAGMPIRRELMHGEYLVTQGQAVKIVYQADGLVVTSEGKSLGNAALLDTVSVRSYGGQLRRGMATAAGVVQVM